MNEPHRVELALDAAFGVAWCVLGVELAVVLRLFTTRLLATGPNVLDGAGVGVGAVAIISYLCSSVVLFVERRDRDEDQSDLSAELGDRVAPRAIAEAECAAFARAALLAALPGSGSAPVAVELIRAGESGVELVLAEPHPLAPPGFESLSDGWVWRVRAELGIDELTHLGAGVATDLPELDALGTDEVSTWYGRAGELELIADGEFVVVEPYGLHLRAMVSTEAATADDAEADSSAFAVESEPVGDGAETEVVAAEAHDGSLVPAGRVEVRILRARPDLVGELRAAPSAPAVEFVAFLATHGYRATMLRLRDGLGTARPRETSQAPTTVWAASGAARRALGEDLVPQAAGNQTYTLSDEVTCDWLRFQQLVALASGDAADDVTVGKLLEEALGLVDEVPACGTRRFSFLETEGTTSAILAEVTAAAERLSAIATTTGSVAQELLAQEKLRLFGGEIERSG